MLLWESSAAQIRKIERIARPGTRWLRCSRVIRYNRRVKKFRSQDDTMNAVKCGVWLSREDSADDTSS